MTAFRLFPCAFALAISAADCTRPKAIDGHDHGKFHKNQQAQAAQRRAPRGRCGEP